MEAKAFSFTHRTKVFADGMVRKNSPMSSAAKRDLHFAADCQLKLSLVCNDVSEFRPFKVVWLLLP